MTDTATPQLPTWKEMSDLDKGAALLHLSQIYAEGRSHAREHYPASYLDSPALKALSPDDACDHAERLFGDTGIEAAQDLLGDDELDRLCDLALEAEQAEETPR